MSYIIDMTAAYKVIDMPNYRVFILHYADLFNSLALGYAVVVVAIHWP